MSTEGDRNTTNGGELSSSNAGSVKAAGNNHSSQSSKKRRPNIQLNKDDHPTGQSDDNDADLNDEGGKRSDPFKRASGKELKKRKIVKASSKWSTNSGAGGIGVGGGTFASVNLTSTSTSTVTDKNSEDDKDGEKKTDTGGGASTKKFCSGGGPAVVFGSTSSASSTGFGSAPSTEGGRGSGFGLGSLSKGFGGALVDSSTKDGESKVKTFGSGFAATTGFEALKSGTAPSFGFGSKSNDASPCPDKNDGSSGFGSSGDSGFGGTFAKGKKEESPKVQFVDDADTSNGEQDEDCIFQVRAKLFRMVEEEENTDHSLTKATVPQFGVGGKLKNEEDKTKEEPKDEGKEGNEKKLVQKEAGVGLVRVLKSKPTQEGGSPDSARVVQRQETSGRVILNTLLVRNQTTVIRRGEKFVQLNAPNGEGELGSSLFKVKATADADSLEKYLNEVMGEQKD